MRWLALAYIVLVLLGLRLGYLRAIAKARMQGREDMRAQYNVSDERIRENFAVVRAHTAPQSECQACRDYDRRLERAMQRGRKRVDDKPDDPSAA